MNAQQLSAMLANLPDDVMTLPVEMHPEEGPDVPVWEIHVIPPDNKEEKRPRIVLRYNHTLYLKRCPLVISEARKGC